ncbi:EamA family transporter RarD [Bacillus luteolus]|uniref:EamA family transporter RarD n=1 Tax=Litchfieldia luteola TaxID=682179 RepID=A0ABR9QM39_9BACI|nr:EamA family transporter RarD [Cytobacillus luteolus]MBE4909575.1 EamA family transporter RarD [Cytobacillus luteolus]MBP1940976.1 chloramphenicol-sensitive protein RarD [Cytobacillus luteolus]
MRNEYWTDHRVGVLYTAGAYILWGFLPLYWKLLDYVPSAEILAHRILWSFIFVVLILAVANKGKKFITECKNVFTTKKALFGVTASAVLISCNWFVYIWAVNHDHIIEASLGYYINPLVSVLLATIVLKEKLNYWQVIAFILAGIGVLILAIQYGQFPWVALTLAISFGLYGLTKKLTKLDSLIGLTFETMIVVPIAIGYLFFLESDGMATFFSASISTKLILVGAGIATAMPLLWFANGAKRIPLSMIGILQYIAPSISLFLGVFLYHEHFTKIHMITFSLIWTALLIYSLSKTKLLVSAEQKFRKGKSFSA